MSDVSSEGAEWVEGEYAPVYVNHVHASVNTINTISEDVELHPHGIATIL